MDLLKELTAIEEGVGFHEPESHFFRVEGPEATAYLNRIVTNEVAGCPVGQGRHQAILDRKGKVLSLFFLYRIGENSYRGIGRPDLIEKTILLLNKMKFIEKVTVTDEGDAWRWAQLIGPDLELFPLERERQRGLIGWRDSFYRIPVINFVGLDGEIAALGAGLRPPPTGVSRQAFDLLRMESGIPEYGVDLDETTILLEVNLSHCVQRGKGCYPGQEVIERILAYGEGKTPRVLRTLFLAGERSVAAGTEILTKGGETVGLVTSALYHPLRQQTVVMGYLDRKFLPANPLLFIGQIPATTGPSLP